MSENSVIKTKTKQRGYTRLFFSISPCFFFLFFRRRRLRRLRKTNVDDALVPTVRARASPVCDSSSARIDLPVKNIEKCSSLSRLSFSLPRARGPLSFSREMIKCRNSYHVLRAREGSCIDRTPAVVARVRESGEALCS